MARNQSMKKNMQNNNNSTQKSVARRRRRRSPITERNAFDDGGAQAPMRQLSFGPSNPGKVFLRGAIELFNGDVQYYFDYNNFNTWFSQARSVLAPFTYYRVNEASVSVKISGGTASAHSVVYNISNSYMGDTTAVSVLNDDFSAIASSALCPVLHPPKSYWKNADRTWYVCLDPILGIPTQTDRIAGTVSFSGSGGANGLTVIGWAVVELELEFHTLT